MYMTGSVPYSTGLARRGSRVPSTATDTTSTIGLPSASSVTSAIDAGFRASSGLFDSTAYRSKSREIYGNLFDSRPSGSSSFAASHTYSPSTSLWGASSNIGVSAWPSYVQQATYNARAWEAQQAYEKMLAQQQQQQGQQQGGSGSSVGLAVDSTGTWSAFNGQANQFINQASAKYGVPANLIKVMIMNESSGNWARDGSRVVYLPTRNQYILPYVGILSGTAAAWGFDFNALKGNMGAQIDAMAFGMKRLYDANPGYGWEGVASTYFSGIPNPLNNYVDENGLSTRTYVTRAMSNWTALDAQSGSQGSMQQWSGGGSGAQNVLSNMFGGKYNVPSWGAYGIPSGNGLYGYGTSYGLNGVQHTGTDIPLPLDSNMYAPSNARVICASTGNGIEGCGAFNDYYGSGAGRIELELPDKTRVIYGHASKSYLRPGQTVTAGQLIGTSGGMNSLHIHLEVRVPDSNMPAGYRIVDPSAYFAGYYGNSGGYSQPAAPQSFMDRVRNAMYGIGR